MSITTEMEMLNELPLKYSELRYRRLFEAAQDGILILNAETGMIEDVNPYLIRMLGYSREEFVQKKLWEVGAFKDIEASKDAFEILQDNKYIRYEDLPLKARSGKLIQVEFVSNVYLAGSEKVIQCNIRNISSRKYAEEVLNKTHVTYRRLFEEAQAGILILDAPTRIDIPAASPAKEGKSLSAENRELRERLDAAEETLRAIRSGEVDAIIVSAADGEQIYTLKKAEKALLDSEMRYHSLFEAAQDGILILDAQTGMIKDVNPFLVSLLGYSREEFVEKKLWEAAAFKDIDVGRAAFEALQASEYIRYEDLSLRAKGGVLVDVEFVSNVYLMGNAKVIQCNIRDISSRKQVEKQVHQHVAEIEMLYENGMTLSQLLSQKAIAQKFIQLLEHKVEWRHAAIRLYHQRNESLELLAFKDPSASVEIQGGGQEEHLDEILFRPDVGLAGWAFQNAQIVRKDDLGSDPRHQAAYTGRQSGLYVPLQSGEHAIGVIAIESEEPNAFNEADERLLFTLANQAAIALENSHLYQTARQEIAQRKRFEILLADEKSQLADRVDKRTADLNHANIDLAYAMRAKDEFLAGMSHELRTPLTSILGFSESLQLKIYGELNEEQTRIVKVIDESGRHLLSLINDILDLAKIDADRLELQLEPCSLADICEASLQLTNGLAQQKNQLVHYSPAAGPVLVRADARRLKQILVNLLGNAIKFTPPGSDLGLEIQLVPSEKIIKLIVWDKGVGIKPEDIHKLFMPFVQIDSGLAREYSGTGLGLSLVKRLTELHNGVVELESKFGAGSRFTIVLPWSPHDTVQTPDGSERNMIAARSVLMAVGASYSSTILIADDNEVISQMFSDFLESVNYRVIRTRNGYELLDRAAQLRPNLILMDIQMPGLEGLKTIREIRSHADRSFAAIPVIALTALAMPGDRERCLQAGASEYISKPVLLPDLAAIIEKQIGRKGPA
jgi:PAS domain S-box-containing protein